VQVPREKQGTRMCLTYEDPLLMLPFTDMAEIELIRLAEQ